MSFNPTYNPPGTTQMVGSPQPQSLTIGGQQIPGYVTTWQNQGDNGNGQTVTNWTAQIHTDDLWDTQIVNRSTFQGTINASGDYVWTPTTNDSLNNLVNDYNSSTGSNDDNITLNDVNSDFNDTSNTGIQATLNNTRDSTLVNQYITSTCDQACAQQKVTQQLAGNMIMGNQQSTTDNTAQQWADVSTQVQNIDLTIDSTFVRRSYGNYYYPNDIRNNGQDRIKFTMKEYGAQRINTTRTTSQGLQNRQFTNIQGSVTLPIQPKIQDRNGVNWGHENLNPLQARAAGLGMAMARQGNLEGALRTAGQGLAQAQRDLMKDDSITKAIQVWLVGQGVGAQNLLSRATGAIANPNKELLFNSPELRSFVYEFRLSPRDEDEAQQVKYIIRFFKQGSAIKTTANNVFLKAPNVFDIKYLTYDGDTQIEHPSINRIKRSACTNVSVDYTPDNSYMTYDDERRTMTSYIMRLSFMELDPIYEKDYHREPRGSERGPVHIRDIGY